jgi:hypothetical protein
MKTLTLPQQGIFSILFICLLSPGFTFAGKSFSPLSTTESLAANLYLLQPDNSTILADGFYAQYNDAYHDSVTIEDALKLTNPSENIALIRYGRTLVLERRPIIKANDTLYLKLWKTTQRRYQVELISSFATNVGLQAYLVDSYLNSNTPLAIAGTIKVDFTVNADPASAATNRFKIIFKSAASSSPLPVTFTDVKAFRLGEDVTIRWSVENEINMAKYEVEKSGDAKTFSLLSSRVVKGASNTSASYSCVDESGAKLNTFYRIKSIGNDGSIKYTQVMKISGLQNVSSFTVYPNPIVGNNINYQLNAQASGIYQVKIINIAGQIVYNNKLVANGNGLTQTIHPDKEMKKGIYQMEVRDAQQNVQVKTILVQ